MTGRNAFKYVFNHDGFGKLAEIARPGLSAEQFVALQNPAGEDALMADWSDDDVVNVLIAPLRKAGMDAIDWCTLTSGQHNCRTRHGFGFIGDGLGREIDRLAGAVVRHFNGRESDLLDILAQRASALGLNVYANIRLNHAALNAAALRRCPGRHFGDKKDFRDPTYHAYLCELAEDFAAKGVAGISLDFERKAPFFPEDAPIPERVAACTRFLRQMRAVCGSLPILARVAHNENMGRAQGQAALDWIREGLVDVLIPATHNHEPDALDWGFEVFLREARQAGRGCEIWPQIWPTGARWTDRDEDDHWHSAGALARRIAFIRAEGAQGVYFFNFCCRPGQVERLRDAIAPAG